MSTVASLAVREARRWIGTPYVHQACCRGAGTDCLGLIRGVWVALYGREPEPVFADRESDRFELGRYTPWDHDAWKFGARLMVRRIQAAFGAG